LRRHLATSARIGDVITITGVQLVSTTVGAALPTVTIGGISATGVTVSARPTDTLTATVADAPSGTTPLTGAVDVVVTPPQASPVTSHNASTRDIERGVSCPERRFCGRLLSQHGNAQ
jgi:hypothetical protein